MGDSNCNKAILYQDVIDAAKQAFSSNPEAIISDIRPAERPYIDDMIVTEERDDFAYVPYGIIIWLKNGDRIIYQLGEKNRNYLKNSNRLEESERADK